jgi:hypothetical protein
MDINDVQKSKNHCGANDLSVTVISILLGNVMKNVCYLHHNGFLIFEQRFTFTIAQYLSRK